MTLKKVPIVRPKVRKPLNSEKNSTQLSSADKLDVPHSSWKSSHESIDNDLNSSRKSKSLTNTPISQRRNGLNSSPVRDHPKMKTSHSTTSCDRRHVRYPDGLPPGRDSNGRTSSFGNIYKNGKSEESIEMVDEFDPSGPLLASSRKSLDNDTDSKTNKSTAKMVKSTTTTSTIPASDTLVLNDDEYAQYVQLSQNMVLQHQVKVKMPFATGTVIYIRGREVILAIALFFFLTLSLGLVVAITREKLMEGGKESFDNNCDTLFCETPESMRHMGNFSLDPCQDFWLYSCEGWLKRNDIPKHRKSWDVSKVISVEVNLRVKKLLESENSTSIKENDSERKAKLMYRQCVKSSGRERNLDLIIDIIKDIGDVTSQRYGLNFKEGMGALNIVKWKYWASVFFEVWVAPDDKIRDKMRIQFDQGGLNLGMCNEYFGKNGTSKKLEAYKNYMKMLKFPGIQDNFVSSTFDFEQKLAQIHLQEGTPEREDPEQHYNNVTVKYMMQIAPQINWLNFLQYAFPYVTEDTTILITSETYFANLSSLIENTQFQVLKQYMLWSVVFKYAQELSLTLRRAANDFHKAITGISSVEERWEYCVRTVGDWFAAAVGAMYVNKYVSRDSIKQLQVMVDDIQRAFADSLKKSHWMSTDTRKNAMRKLGTMSHIIGYPSYILNDSVLENMYKKFQIKENDTFFNSLLSGVNNEKYLMSVQLESNRIFQRPDVPPHGISAYYTFPQNMIILQSGILEPPHYHQNIDRRVVNYGAIGSIIGHEMVHGFDNIGGQYDEHGVPVIWWSDKSSGIYDDRLQCLVDQYSRYSEDGVPINGEMTLEENMADIEGLKLSFKAWRKYQQTHRISNTQSARQHSNDQLFFLAFAQNWCGKQTKASRRALSVHAPAKIRVKGTLSNLEEFSKAFNCPAGSTYNPRNKCSVWD